MSYRQQIVGDTFYWRALPCIARLVNLRDRKTSRRVSTGLPLWLCCSRLEVSHHMRRR